MSNQTDISAQAAETIDLVRETFRITKRGIQGRVTTDETDHLNAGKQQRETNITNTLAQPSQLQGDFNAESMHEALSILVERFEKLAYRNDIPIPNHEKQAIADILKSELEQNANHFNPTQLIGVVPITLYHGADLIGIEQNPKYDAIKAVDIILSNPIAPNEALEKEVELNSNAGQRILALGNAIKNISQDPKDIPAPLWAQTLEQEANSEALLISRLLTADERYGEIPEWAFDYIANTMQGDPEDNLESVTLAIDELRENDRYNNLPNWSVILSAIYNPEDAANVLNEALDTANKFEKNTEFEHLRDRPETFLYAALQQPQQRHTYLRELVGRESSAVPESADVS